MVCERCGPQEMHRWWCPSLRCKIILIAGFVLVVRVVQILKPSTHLTFLGFGPTQLQVVLVGLLLAWLILRLCLIVYKDDVPNQ